MEQEQTTKLNHLFKNFEQNITEKRKTKRHSRNALKEEINEEHTKKVFTFKTGAQRKKRTKIKWRPSKVKNKERTRQFFSRISCRIHTNRSYPYSVLITSSSQIKKNDQAR